MRGLKINKAHPREAIAVEGKKKKRLNRSYIGLGGKTLVAKRFSLKTDLNTESGG